MGNHENNQLLPFLTQRRGQNLPSHATSLQMWYWYKHFSISNQGAKGLTSRDGLKVKQLAKKPPTLKMLIRENFG